MGSYMCAHLYTIVCVCVCACVRACVRACMRACVRACVCVCMRACVHACVPACVYSLSNKSTILFNILPYNWYYTHSLTQNPGYFNQPNFNYTPNSFLILSIIMGILCGLFSPATLTCTIPAIFFSLKVHKCIIAVLILYPHQSVCCCRLPTSITILIVHDQSKIFPTDDNE